MEKEDCVHPYFIMGEWCERKKKCVYPYFILRVAEHLFLYAAYWCSFINRDHEI